MRLTHNLKINMWLVWIGLAIVLCGSVILLRLTASNYAYGTNLIDMPIAEFASMYVLLGLIFAFALPWMIRNTSTDTRYMLLFVIVIGFIARLGFVGGATILEDDYNRYLWDGAVTAAGENPYAHSPDEIREQRQEGDVFDVLINQSGTVFERINFPQFSTVYPPAAQVVFAITHWISPFNLDALRLVLMLFEVGCLAFIFAILNHFGRSPLWAAFYWWNPLVIKEVLNSAHMEPLLMLPVLAAFYLVFKQRFYFASAMLAIAAGIKIWPALLVIVIWRQLLGNFKQLVLSGLIFSLILGLMVLPIVLTGLTKNSGFVAFGGQWQASSSAYLVSEWLANQFTPYWVDDYVEIPLVSRLVLGLVLMLFITALCFRFARNADENIWRMFLIIAAIYLLAPSHTPWYFIWLAPFLCIYPIRGLMLAGALIPLHYTYFHFAVRDMEDFYHHGIVWLIWLPVWALLAFEVIKKFPNFKTGELVR